MKLFWLLFLGRFFFIQYLRPPSQAQSVSRLMMIIHPKIFRIILGSSEFYLPSQGYDKSKTHLENQGWDKSQLPLPNQGWYKSQLPLPNWGWDKSQLTHQNREKVFHPIIFSSTHIISGEIFNDFFRRLTQGHLLRNGHWGMNPLIKLNRNYK